MKWGTPDHPKAGHLAGLLKLETYAVVGLLELLWHWVSKYRADGSLEGVSDHAIAAACRWTGEPARLVQALEGARWIDVEPMRRVHGWSEHAENAVHAKLARAGMLFCDGVVPKVGDLDGKSRERERASERLAEAKAKWDAEASLPAVSPGGPRGESSTTPRLALAVASETNGTTTAPPTPHAQRSLAMGPKPLPPKPTQPAENVEALKSNVQELAELLDLDFDRTALFITSGMVHGRKACAGTLSFETMSEKHMRRSIVDSNTAIDALPERRGPSWSSGRGRRVKAS